MFQRIVKYIYINFQFVFAVTGFIWNIVNFNSPIYIVVLSLFSAILFFPIITLLVVPYIFGIIEYIVSSDKYKKRYIELFHSKAWIKNIDKKILTILIIIYFVIIAVTGIILAINNINILYVQIVSFLLSLFGCVIFVLLRNYLMFQQKDNSFIFSLLFLNPMIKDNKGEKNDININS